MNDNVEFRVAVSKLGVLDRTNSAMIVTDTSVGHNGITQNRQFKMGRMVDFSSTQISMGQVGIKSDFLQHGILQISVGEISSIDIGLPQIGFT